MSDSLPPHFSWVIPPNDERDLDALLSGEVTDIPVALRPLADTLTALKGQPTPAELRGEAAIMAEFRAQAEFGPFRPARPGGRAKTLELPTLQPGSRPRSAARHRVRRPANRRFGAFLVAAAAAAIVGAVAFTGNLPGPIQRLAHTHQAAPSTARPSLQDRSASSVRPVPHKSVRPSPSPSPSASASPSASPNASTLCRTFFSSVEQQGTGQQWRNSPAYRRLSAEAGGSGRIGVFCGPYLKEMFPNGVPTQFLGSFMSGQQGFGNGSQGGNDGNTAPGQNASHPAKGSH